jgi:hypothetical protein
MIRQMQLESYIPQIWSRRSFLYVGASIEQFDFRYSLAMAYDFFNAQVEVFEIDEDRANAVLKKYPWIQNVYIDDIGNGRLLGARRSYDVGLWINGPGLLEEVKKIDLALASLEAVCTELLVAMNPWGNYPYQNGEDELLHPKDVYRTPLTPEFFLRRGFAVHLMGEKDTKGGNILAWKDLRRKPKSWRRQPCPDEGVYAEELRKSEDCF